MKRWRKLLAMLLSMVMILSMIPSATVRAEEIEGIEEIVEIISEETAEDAEALEAEGDADADAAEGEEALAEAEEEAEAEVAEEEDEEAEAEEAEAEEGDAQEEVIEEIIEEIIEEEPELEEVIFEESNYVEASAKNSSGASVLAFTSDTHNKSGNVAANRLKEWLTNVKEKLGTNGKVDVMAFGGDMAGAGASGYWDLTKADMDVVAEAGVTGVYTTGNHEIASGGDFKYASYTSGAYKNDAIRGKFEVNKTSAEGDNYIVYCLGSESDTQSYSNQVSSLTSFLSSAGNNKVIFIITHFPLHYFSNGYSRTTTGASQIIDVLNNAVTNNNQTIVFLWGHNHTLSDTYYDQIYGPGGTNSISYNSSGSSKTINFYYGGAGCMSDYENTYNTNSGSAFVKGKGLLVTVASSGNTATLNFAYYDENGTDVTESNSVKTATVTLGTQSGTTPDPTPGDTARYELTDTLSAGEYLIV
ncbi:MAG: metallophosphoesterase, partial [Lachnospiraceae bacterium]|nr:metallophosphoesterase [Lachnospiraceae bacterium]